jgi:hypothetical protein
MGMFYIVVIEWDGDIPPTGYYKRIHKLGLIVRGSDKNKELSALRRRALREGAVIAQEGVFLCASASLQRAIAGLALGEGAKGVMVGTAEIDEFHMNADDVVVANTIQAICGRVGRPSDPKSTWSITCHEEMRTYRLEDERYALSCPYCSSLMITGIVGEPIAYSLPQDGDHFTAWMRNRFAQGRFENVGQGTTEPPAAPVIMDETMRAEVENMRNSAAFITEINKLANREFAVRVLDGVLSAHFFLDNQIAGADKVRAVVRLMEQNVNPTKLKLAILDGKYDVLDAASTLGVEGAVAAWHELYG